MPAAKTLEEKYGTTFERTLAYLLLFDPGFAEQIANGIDPSLFHNVHYKQIVSVFCALVSRHSGQIPTYATIIPILKKRMVAMPASRQDVLRSSIRIARNMKRRMKHPSDSDAITVQQELSTFISHRNLQAALLESADLLDKGEFEQIRELVENAAKSGDMSVADDAGLEYTDIKSRLAFYEKAKEVEFHAPIGVRRIDEIMRGGLEPGALGIFLAPTRVGKTRALVNVGTMCIMKKLNVAHVSLELVSKEIGHRYDARMTGVPINAFVTSPGKYNKKLLRAFRKIKGRLFIRSWGSGAASVSDVRAYLKQRAVQDDFHTDVVLVDYIDLLKPIQRRGEVRFELADTTRALRCLAEDLGCAVWTASQTTKANWDNETLTLSAIAEAAEKANVADVVIGLCQTSTEKRKHLMRMIILKNRQGGKEGTSVDCVVSDDTQVIRQAAIQRSAARPSSNTAKAKQRKKTNGRV